VDGAIPQRGTPAWNILMQPRRHGQARGHVRASIKVIQKDLLEQLCALDADANELVTRRERIVADLRRCRDALGSYETRPRRREPLPGDVDAQPAGTKALAGTDLREVLVDILRSAERPLTVRALHRSLLALGRNVTARPSKSIPDALRTAVRRGDARRIRPGVYAAVMPSGS